MSTKKRIFGLMGLVCVLALVFAMLIPDAGKAEAASGTAEESADNTAQIYWAFEPTTKKGKGTLHLGGTEYTGDKYTEKGSFGIGEKFSDEYDEDDKGNIRDPEHLSPWIRKKINEKIIKVSIDDIIQPLTTAYWFQNLWHLETIENLDRLDTSQVTDMSGMFDWCGSLTSLDLTGFDTSQVRDMSWMFRGCGSLTSLDLTGFDTSQVRDMSGMFCECNDLTSLDVTGFDTSQVRDMSWMFDECNDLTSLDVTGFDTSQVTDMFEMFSGCWDLTSLDLTGFDTSHVTDMRLMFCGCSSLTSLDLTGFDTSHVTSMYEMFGDCKNLTSLDLTGFDTSQVRDMSWMFQGCGSLTSLDLTGFDTSHVKDMSGMFCECNDLTSLDVTGFDTSHVTDMRLMFHGCSSLTSLDLTGFDTLQVTSMSWMFENCKSLITIYASDFTAASGVAGMFSGCSKLVGGNGTAYSKKHKNIDYARVDSEGTPGYFTSPDVLNKTDKKTDKNTDKNTDISDKTEDNNDGNMSDENNTPADATDGKNPEEINNTGEDSTDAVTDNNGEKSDIATDETMTTDKGDESELTAFLTETLSVKILKVTCRPEDAVNVTRSKKQYRDAEGNVIKNSFVIINKGYVKYVGKDGKLVKSRFIAYTDEETGRTSYYYARKTGVIAKNWRITKKYTVNGKTKKVLFFAGSDRALCYNEFAKDRKGNTVFARKDGTLACSGEYETVNGVLTFDAKGRVISQQPDEK